MDIEFTKSAIIMIIVIVLAGADVVTGMIKAKVSNTMKSRQIRAGGLKKLSEIVIMLTVCIMDYMFTLGERKGVLPANMTLISLVTSMTVFTYIGAMELVSIFENYLKINPKAKWVKKIIGKEKDDKE